MKRVKIQNKNLLRKSENQSDKKQGNTCCCSKRNLTAFNSLSTVGELGGGGETKPNLKKGSFYNLSESVDYSYTIFHFHLVDVGHAPQQRIALPTGVMRLDYARWRARSDTTKRRQGHLLTVMVWLRHCMCCKSGESFLLCGLYLICSSKIQRPKRK